MSIFFLAAMGCHARLAASRRHGHLTEFYFWMGSEACSAACSTRSWPRIVWSSHRIHLMVVAALMLMPPRSEVRGTRPRPMAGLRRAGVGVPGSAGLAVIFYGDRSENRILPNRLYFIFRSSALLHGSGRHVSDSASRRS